jgi:hypothetical protein
MSNLTWAADRISPFTQKNISQTVGASLFGHSFRGGRDEAQSALLAGSSLACGMAMLILYGMSVIQVSSLENDSCCQ